MTTPPPTTHLEVTDGLVSGHLERVQRLSAQEQLHDERWNTNGSELDLKPLSHQNSQ